MTSNLHFAPARILKAVVLCTICFFAVAHTAQAHNLNFVSVNDSTPKKKAVAKSAKSSTKKSSNATNTTKPKTTTKATPKTAPKATTTPKAGGSKDCQRKAIKAVAPVFTTVAEQVMIKPACGSTPAQYITLSKQVLKMPATYEESMEACDCKDADKTPTISEVMSPEKYTTINKKDCDGKTTAEQVLIRPAVKEFRIVSPK